MSERVEVVEKKKSGKKIALIVILVLIIAALGTAVYFLATQEHQTAVITETQEQLSTPDEDNMLRVKMNTGIIVQEGTMQNLEFYNLNEGRYLQLKIKVGDEYVYESQYLAQGEVIKADIIDEGKLKDGSNEALAEIYSYDLDKNLIGQRNVEITLSK